LLCSCSHQIALSPSCCLGIPPTTRRTGGLLQTDTRNQPDLQPQLFIFVIFIFRCRPTALYALPTRFSVTSDLFSRPSRRVARFRANLAVSQSCRATGAPVTKAAFSPFPRRPREQGISWCGGADETGFPHDVTARLRHGRKLPWETRRWNAKRRKATGALCPPCTWLPFSLSSVITRRRSVAGWLRT
jgi:hypothetical protein